MYFVKKNNIVKRVVHDTVFLIDITQNYLNDKCFLYELNEIGSFIWDALDMTDTVDGVTDMLMSQLAESVDRNEVYKDISEFIDLLVMEGFVRSSDGRD